LGGDKRGDFAVTTTTMRTEIMTFYKAIKYVCLANGAATQSADCPQSKREN